MCAWFPPLELESQRAVTCHVQSGYLTWSSATVVCATCYPLSHLSSLNPVSTFLSETPSARRNRKTKKREKWADWVRNRKNKERKDRQKETEQWSMEQKHRLKQMNKLSKQKGGSDKGNTEWKKKQNQEEEKNRQVNQTSKNNRSS